MARPTISLACIMKNERENLPRLLSSVKDCFDEIVLVDTGSNDGSVEYAGSDEAKALCNSPVRLFYFQWCDDFSAARNFAFEKVTSDYVMWLDLDDALKNKEAFIIWRDTAMQFSDFWLAKYAYALDDKGNPVISFARERVFNAKKKPQWRYFIHEGIVRNENMSQPQYITTWSVDHHRTAEDINKDKSRNLRIFEAKKDQLDARLMFYYGKELYEADKKQEAFDVLIKAAGNKDLEHHDRVLSLQYCCYAAIEMSERMKEQYSAEWLAKAIDIGLRGIQIEPQRAEFYVSVGDCFLRNKELAKALPFFAAAEHCLGASDPSAKYAGAIFNYQTNYKELPLLQKARIYFNLGDIDSAEREAQKCWDKYKNEEALKMLEELKRVKPLVSLSGPREKVDEIVITCPPQNAYEFDEELYKTKAMGGSETALINVAKYLKELTGKTVKVFNMRSQDLKAESGVEYISSARLNEYMSKFEPKVHIAWRHNIKITNAPTYLWAHDLLTPTIEVGQNFDKMMCLSEFHKSYTVAMTGVDPEKIVLIKNGLVPEKFEFQKKPKNENKFLWMSSPDRGLDRAIVILDKIKEARPNVELHVYYGLENLYKYGLGPLADKLKKMMSDRPWIKYHGFTEQSKMYEEVSDGVIWLHPCNFIETFCITALEMLSLGVYPITRKLGALQNTLADAESKGMATLFDEDGSEQNDRLYIEEALKVLDEKRWEKIVFDPKEHSWRKVAESFLDFMPLK